MLKHRSIQTLGLLLAAVCGLAGCATVVLITWQIVDFKVFIPEGGTVRELKREETTAFQQGVILLLLNLPGLFWMWGLAEMARLGLLCRVGLQLTEKAARRFEVFGIAVLCMAVAEMSAVPLLVTFVRSQGLADPSVEILDLIVGSGGLNSLAAAAVIALTARIVRISAQLAEETSLTV